MLPIVHCSQRHRLNQIESLLVTVLTYSYVQCVLKEATSYQATTHLDPPLPLPPIHLLICGTCNIFVPHLKSVPKKQHMNVSRYTRYYDCCVLGISPMQLLCYTSVVIVKQ